MCTVIYIEPYMNLTKLIIHILRAIGELFERKVFKCTCVIAYTIRRGDRSAATLTVWFLSDTNLKGEFHRGRFYEVRSCVFCLCRKQIDEELSSYSLDMR